MILTAQEANALLDTLTTKEQLRALIEKLDISASGKTTILYGGTTANGVSNSDIVQGMLRNGDDIRVIDKTEAAKFLNVDPDSPNYNRALVDKLEQIIGGSPNSWGSPSNQFLQGEIGPDGTTRIPNGAWDNVSARFVDATVGEVRTLTGEASPERVFGQTELPHALRNDKITSIDGVARATLQEMGEGEAFKTIRAASHAYSAELRVAIDANGDVFRGVDGLPRLDARTYFSATRLEGKPPLVDLVNYKNLAEYIPPERLAQHVEGVTHWQEIKADLIAQASLPGPENAISRAAARTALDKLGIAGDVIALALVVNDANAAYSTGNTAGAQQILEDWAIGFTGGVAGGLLAGKLVGAALAPLYLTGPAGSVIAGGLTLLAGIAGAIGGEQVAYTLADAISTAFTAAQNFVQLRSDPLVLDLDGDGLETAGINAANPIYFDHDGDGNKSSSGWVEADDGFLVLDRNGNATIDDGTELFGDSTPLASGGEAVDGFDALAQEDTNGDGQVNSQDANWADLRVWRDLNQDAVSQAEELITLDELGIVALNVSSTSHSLTLTNGNRLADLGTYVKSDGSVAGLGETGNTGDVDLVQDTFQSQFTQDVPLTPQAHTLPDMEGSGQVRSLREAASLSPALAGLVAQFVAATREERLVLLDEIILAWSDTSTMPTTFDGAYAGQSLTVNMPVGGADYLAWTAKLSIIERFNGRTFNQVPAGTGTVTVTMFNGTMTLLQNSYNELKSSVYMSLQIQTRLKPLLDKIQLVADQTGIRLDFTALEADFDARIAADRNSGLRDLAEFTLVTKDLLKDSGWNGATILAGYLDGESTTQANGSSTRNIVLGDDFSTSTGGGTGNDIVIAGIGNDLLDGGSGNDLIFGGDGNDSLIGSGGSDTMVGGAGNDRLFAGGYDWRSRFSYGYAEATGNTLNGGTGTDQLYGGGGSDSYIYNVGDGSDTIHETGQQVRN